MEYTLAFLFLPGQQVALARKKSPDWQKGKLNGLGGKVEDGETPILCVQREVFEESGIELTDEDLNPFAIVNFTNKETVYAFWAKLDHEQSAKMNSLTDTGEVIERVHINEITGSVGHARWLIQAALSDMKTMRDRTGLFITASYVKV